MAISPDNTRIMITLSQELADQVKNKADKDGRTVSNWIAMIIKKELEQENNPAK